MNHVITGYEPTAPGEIARSGFLWAANDSRRNWLEFLVTLSIHESGVLNHGAIRAKVSTLDRQGVPELFGEGLERGSQCSADLSQVDHLALVEPTPRSGAGRTVQRGPARSPPGGRLSKSRGWRAESRHLTSGSGSAPRRG